jgi:hypothetical protein
LFRLVIFVCADAQLSGKIQKPSVIYAEHGFVIGTKAFSRRFLRSTYLHGERSELQCALAELLWRLSQKIFRFSFLSVVGEPFDGDGIFSSCF